MIMTPATCSTPKRQTWYFLPMWFWSRRCFFSIWMCSLVSGRRYSSEHTHYPTDWRSSLLKTRHTTSRCWCLVQRRLVRWSQRCFWVCPSIWTPHVAGTHRIKQDNSTNKWNDSEDGTTHQPPVTTNYYSVGPSELIDLLLFLEADRMVGLDITREVESTAEVVRNERRQNY